MIEILEKMLCSNKYIFLKGKIQGAISNFVNPIKDTTQLWNFDSEPIFSPYGTIPTYIVISKYNNVDAPNSNPYFNIQIIYLFPNNSNLLQLGTGIFTDDKIKFNQTETSVLMGEISYDCGKNIFKLVRFSSPPATAFIDSGNFIPISQSDFEHETKIKV